MKKILLMFIFVALCGGLCGCARFATAGKQTAEVELLPSGEVVHNNRRVKAEALPARLRSQGYRPGRAMVEVSLTSGTGATQVRNISAILATAGYGRVVFITQRQVSVETENQAYPSGH